MELFAATVRDLKIGLRSLLKSPTFTIAAVVTLAFGIGANTAIFSVVNSVLVRGLPYQDPDRVAIIWNDYGSGGQSLPAVSAPDFRDYQQRARLFEGFAGGMNGTAELTSNNGSRQVDVAFVTSNFFSLLGVKPLLGRGFNPDETVPNGPHVAILTYRLWQQRFGGKSDIVGQTVSIGRVPHTIVGVLPSGFALELPPEKFMTDDADIYQPIQRNFDAIPRNLTGTTVLARLKPGVSWAQAQSEMDGIAAQLRSEHLVHKMSGMQIRVVPLKADIVKNVRLALLVMMGAVSFVLLIACGNVANLLLSRATARQKEMAVRSALGASRTQLARYVLAESLVVSAMGAVSGTLLAVGGVRLLLALRPAGLPRLNDVSVGGWTFAYTAAMALFTALVFGLVPALQASRPNLTGVLVEGGRGNSRGGSRFGAGRLLIVGQVALSVVLLTGCGLLLQSFAQLLHVKPGFRAEHVLTLRTALPVASYRTDEAVETAYRRILEQLRDVPGVEAASANDKLPLTGSGPQTPYAWDDETARHWETISADWRSVTPDYFRAMGINFTAGRPFVEQDDQQHPGVVIVDESLAKRAWPGQNAVGKRLLIDDPQLPHEWLTVIGVTEHVRAHDLARNVREQVYVSFQQRPSRLMQYAIKTQGDPTLAIPAVVQAIHGFDPQLAVSQIQPMQEYVSLAMAQAKFTLLLSGIFGAVAALLTAIGIYGLISYFTTQRTREFGIRLALGAQRTDIHRMVLREGLGLAFTGVIGGTVIAVFVTRLMGGLLYGVSPNDPLTLLGVPVVLAGIALLATHVPARRATRVDPMVALRFDA